ncbi:MAG: hypothetical protein HN704_08640 [Bacteroidetes bacterium]|jgi:hypothetical protein|nr:hypothetical protein [Bacteroidota bacterium]MBT6685914.1 hypothetical protein [Bacteroidota bacterium]MBT7143133.1 hypothetical protein [Bacteroidota bacterium]MBT7491659.1 hypothetical protein [Bacteroidota bacterium]
MEEKSLFQISVEDAQSSAKYRIGRKLSDEELNDLQKYLQYAFEDWGFILKDAILKTTGAKEIATN